MKSEKQYTLTPKTMLVSGGGFLIIYLYVREYLHSHSCTFYQYVTKTLAVSQPIRSDPITCHLSGFLSFFAGKHSTNFVSRYDPRFNSWIQLPPMQER